jgi:hypothetical protein
MNHINVSQTFFKTLTYSSIPEFETGLIRELESIRIAINTVITELNTKANVFAQPDVQQAIAMHQQDINIIRRDMVLYATTIAEMQSVIDDLSSQLQLQEPLEE